MWAPFDYEDDVEFWVADICCPRCQCILVRAHFETKKKADAFEAMADGLLREPCLRCQSAIRKERDGT